MAINDSPAHMYSMVYCTFVPWFEIFNLGCFFFKIIKDCNNVLEAKDNTVYKNER